MPAYLFHLELQPFNEEIGGHVPEHRAYINQLFQEGRVLSYSVATQRSMIWCVIDALTEQEAMDIVSKFPLYKFCTDITCHSLLIHNTQPSVLPDISLN